MNQKDCLTLCKRCKKKLKNEKSIKLGYGNICLEKIKVNKTLGELQIIMLKFIDEALKDIEVAYNKYKFYEKKETSVQNKNLFSF